MRRKPSSRSSVTASIPRQHQVAVALVLDDMGSQIGHILAHIAIFGQGDILTQGLCIARK